MRKRASIVDRCHCLTVTLTCFEISSSPRGRGLEIGLGYGSSALAIAEALSCHEDDSVSHIIIDPFQEHFRGAGLEILADLGLSTCQLIEERSQLALPRLLESGLVVDAAFVDGSHVFHNVFVDLVFLREIVRPGGLVILDDYEWPSVAMAARYFETNLQWAPEELSTKSRLRVFRLPDPPVERAFDQFVPFDAR